jgi:pSer/pThr/pTyr-binding forkhead associated (FHA) protein
MEAKLLVLNGKHKDREIPLPRTMFLIGRDAECHLRLHSHQVSRRHCAIACWAGKVLVRDLKSANGTFVNNQRIAGEVKVGDGDRLQVGPLAFVFRLKNPAGPDEPPEPITPGSLRWLLEHARDAKRKDLDGSTELEIIAGLSGLNSQDKTDAPSATFSPGDYFLKSIRPTKSPVKPGHLHIVPPTRNPPGGGPENPR